MQSSRFFLSVSGILLLLSSLWGIEPFLVDKTEEDDPVVSAPKTAYDSLSFEQKIDLLIAVKVEMDSDLEGLDRFHNLYLGPKSFRESTLDKVEVFKGLRVVNLEDVDEGLPTNLQLGAANEKEAVGVKYDDIALRSRLIGANVLLSNEFNQLLQSGAFNQTAYTQSPYYNQQYWRTSSAALMNQGVLLGGKGFFTGLENNRQSLAVLQTFHFAGLRELARSSSSVLQIEEAICKKLDTLPAVYSKKILEDIVRDNQGYQGVLIGPDFSSKSIVSQANDALRSLNAGLDMVVVGLPALDAVRLTLTNHFKKRKKRLDEKARKIFKLRRDLNAVKGSPKLELVDVQQFQYQADVASLTILKNDENVWPIKDLNKRFVVSSLSADFDWQVNQYVDFENSEALTDVNSGDVILVHAEGQDLRKKTQWMKGQSFQQSLLVVDYEDIYRYRALDLSVYDGIIVCPTYASNQVRVAVQSAFGAIDVEGKLPFYLNPSFPTFSGIILQSIERLAYSAPESLGLNLKYLRTIDSIAQAAIKAGAFPGCQIQMTWKGHVVYQSAQGKVAHNQPKQTDLSILYDLASITKIAGSTIGLMALQENNQLKLSNKVQELWSGVPAGHEMGNMVLKDMMAHQAGLPSWIPFYTKTVQNNRPLEALYSTQPTAKKATKVAKDLYILNSYSDTIYNRIFDQRLKDRRYKYSDLGYYFVKQIIEQQSGQHMEEFLMKRYYQPLGLRTLTYRPLEKFDLSRIAPTENDRLFRQQTVHGHVHDPGAAMLGGVGGHAGLFSNANDLSVLMQMLLNGGTYGGQRYLKKSTIDEYTAVQFPGKNRRGAGFDKPKEKTGGGTCAEEASMSSYGHSGFTGTLTWVDPKYDLNYVFLSNRVNPDAENWKIVRMNVRTDIQSQMIQAIQNARSKSYFSSWDLVDLKKSANQ